MNRFVILTSLFLVCRFSVISQNCWNTSTGMPPINDLGTAVWRGLQGGLYPGGMNTRPSPHNDDGIDISSHIRPLATNGVPDTATGKVVLMSVGMSNAEQEFGKFELFCDTLSNKNPRLEVVNGAQGGWHISKILDPDTAYWSTIDSVLQGRGLSALQVQVVWFKEADFHPAETASDTSFPGYTFYIEGMFKEALHIMKAKYPNLKLCYVSSRIYGGYDETGGNPEPYAYYQGWAVKELIEGQINGDTALVYSGPNARSPWLSWAPYLWADGITPRNDGLRWICPDDYLPDGRHPSNPVGREKVAHILMNFFTSDETTMPWFLTTESPPVVPSQLMATATSYDRILLTWSDNSSNESGFKIERKDLSTSFQEIASVSAGTVTYLDTGLSSATKYVYRVRAYNDAGPSPYSNKASATTPLPGEAWHAFSAHPNPFNPVTTFSVKLEEPANVALRIFNMLGQEVATIIDDRLDTGVYRFRWDTGNNGDFRVSSGVYLAMLQIGKTQRSIKIMLVR